MQNDDRLTPPERELEAVLGGLRPAHSKMNRDCVMYLAGRMSTRRQNRIWQGLSFFLVAMLVVSIISKPRRPAAEVRPEIVADATPNMTGRGFSARSPEPFERRRFESFVNYVRTRRAVLDRGMEALPASRATPPAGGEPPLTRERLIEILSST